MHVKDSVISRWAFNPSDLSEIEKIMSLTIASCDRYGKLVIQGGEFIPTVRSTWATGLTPIPTQWSTPMPAPHTTIIAEKIMLSCLPFPNSVECIYSQSFV